MRGKRYFHLKTGNPYELITDNHMVKLNGEWIKGLVLYEAKYYNPDGYYFARTKEDFDEHFVDEKNCPIEFLLKEKLRKRSNAMTIEEVKEELINGTFDDCDGYAYYATDTMVSDVEISDEEIMEGTYRPEFTHVVVHGK